MMAETANSPVTYNGIVQPWECDANQHWNVRFYIRAFQAASEAFALMEAGTNPGAATARVRHVRFHRELFGGDAIAIRSGRLTEGAFSGRVCHFMEHEGRLMATALDRPDYDLPDEATPWPDQQIGLAVPRGLSGEPDAPGADGAEPGLMHFVVGAVTPAMSDHTGALVLNEIFAFCSSASHTLLSGIGFTRAWSRETGCGRMAVELKIRRHGDCRPGDVMQVRSKIAAVRSKTFATRHRLETLGDDRLVATVEQCIVVADLQTRRAVPVPEFVGAAFARGAGGQG